MNELYNQLKQNSRENLIHLALSHKKTKFHKKAIELGFTENQVPLLFESISTYYKTPKITNISNTGSHFQRVMQKKLQERDAMKQERDAMKQERDYAYKQMMEYKNKMSQYESLFGKMQDIMNKKAAK
eukprot:79286_1